MALLKVRRFLVARSHRMLMQVYPSATATLSLRTPRVRRFRSRPRSNEFLSLMQEPKNEKFVF